MSAKDTVVVGGEPRIDFLPPEIRQKKKNRRVVRSLVLLVGLVVAVCAVAYVGVTGLAVSRHVALEIERERTQQLLREQQEYAEAAAVANTLQLTENALRAASATEVIWMPYIEAVRGVLPADSTITEVRVDQQTATEQPTEVVDSLFAKHTGTAVVSAQLPTLGAVAAWVDAVEDLPGVAGLTVGQAQLEDETGYVVQLTLNIAPDAAERRFFDAPAEGDTPGDTAAGTESASDATGAQQ